MRIYLAGPLFSTAEREFNARLAALLQRSGTMRWTGARQRYQCDLGFGGAMFDVGSARQIWERRATVTVEMLTRARGAAAPGPAPQRGGNAGVRMAAPPRISPADVAAMQGQLRDEFDLADANWSAWSAS